MLKVEPSAVKGNGSPRNILTAGIGTAKALINHMIHCVEGWVDCTVKAELQDLRSAQQFGQKGGPLVN